MFRVGMAAAILLGLADCASAAVVEVSAAGFEVKNEVTVNASSEPVYFALLHDIGHWWNSKHTYSGDSANLSIEPRPGTNVGVKYSVGGYMHGGFDSIAPAVDAVLRDRLERLKRHVETRKAP